MSGITRGWVRADWARRHHAKWVAAIEGGVGRTRRPRSAIAFGPVLIYVAGPLFSEAERAWLDVLAARLRGEGFDCFVPHENFSELKELTPGEVFRVDAAGVRGANVLLAWLDGPVVDDGTACEIGMFAELVASGDPRYRGIVGIVTDLRLQRRRGNAVGDGMNLFVIGAIEANGRVCWSVDEAVDALRELAAGSRLAALDEPLALGCTTSRTPPPSVGRASKPMRASRLARERRARAARADRVDRPPGSSCAGGAERTSRYGKLDRAGEPRLLALARLAHVEHLRVRVGVEQARELRHGDGLRRLGPAARRRRSRAARTARPRGAAAPPRRPRPPERACTTSGSPGSSTNAARVANEPPSSATLIAPATWPATKSSTGRASSTVASPGPSSSRSGGRAATHGPRFSATQRSVVGGRGVVSDADSLDERAPRRRAGRGSVSLLAADRRRVLVAHVRAAERARDVAGIDDRRVGQLGQPAQRVPQVGGALARLDREVGPRRLADEHRVAGQHELAADDERAVLGPVAGRVPHDDLDRADADRPGRRRAHRTGTRAARAGGSRRARRARARSGRGPRGGRRACASRARARSARRPSRRGVEVRLDRERGVDHDRLARVGVADEVGAAAEVVVDELAEEHARNLTGSDFPAAALGPASGRPSHAWIRIAAMAADEPSETDEPQERLAVSSGSTPTTRGGNLHEEPGCVRPENELVASS